MPEIFLLLSDAAITLYRTDSNGDAITDAPVFIGACAKDLRLAYRFDERESTPTGVNYPVTHHLNPRHEISIERLWVVNQKETPDAEPADFKLERNQQFVMAIVWKKDSNAPVEMTNRWHARIYHGTTTSAYDLTSVDVMEFTGSQSFKAQYFIERNGIGAVTCPP